MAGKTEWEDILISKGIIAKPVVGPTEDELQLQAIEEAAGRDHLADKSLAELDDLEDEFAEDVLESYRDKRLAELKMRQQRERFGSVRNIGQTEYKQEVSEADIWVVVHLFVFGKPECQLLNLCMDKVAARFRDVKFLRIVSTEAIPNYPDKNCPTLLVYHNGEIKSQTVGLTTLGGLKMTPDCLEWELARQGVVKTELDENPLLKAERTKVTRGPVIKSAKVGSRASHDDSDDDW